MAVSWWRLCGGDWQRVDRLLERVGGRGTAGGYRRIVVSTRDGDAYSAGVHTRPTRSSAHTHAAYQRIGLSAAIGAQNVGNHRHQHDMSFVLCFRLRTGHCFCRNLGLRVGVSGVSRDRIRVMHRVRV